MVPHVVYGLKAAACGYKYSSLTLHAQEDKGGKSTSTGKQHSKNYMWTMATSVAATIALFHLTDKKGRAGYISASQVYVQVVFRNLD